MTYLNRKDEKINYNMPCGRTIDTLVNDNSGAKGSMIRRSTVHAAVHVNGRL